MAFCCYSCDKNEHPSAPVTSNDSILVKGTGSFVFQNYLPLKSKPVRVWYHIPEKSTVDSKILIVFTGANRDAMESRNAIVTLADQKNIMVFVPEFSDSLYPGADEYNMGNVFVNGDKPSASTLNPEEEWTFSLIDPLYEYVRIWTGHSSSGYDVFGHSAGGQFVHRFIYFKPDAKVNRAVASSAGWYTMPDTSVSFPYGLGLAPFNLLQVKSYFTFPLEVCVGQKDNDPNSAGLRHTTQADKQGLNRLERAAYFFNESKVLAGSFGSSFSWNYHVIPNADHDFSLTSAYGINLLYP